MARDHARINLDLWGDDDWMDLSVDAQMLYLTLYTSPGLSFCGAVEWAPAKLTQRSSDWTVERIESAAAELSRALFLVIDTKTGECLLRSWIKHDGLWRTPNMAVTVANARGDLASRTLRAVVVFEVLKLRTANPDSSSWGRPAVQKMLSQKAVDAATLEPFNPGPNGGPNGGARGGPNPTSNPYGHPGAKGGSKGGPTPAPTPSSNSIKGYVGTEGDCEPPSRCPAHINSTQVPNCGACADARRTHEQWQRQQQQNKLARRRALKAIREGCPNCDPNGLVETDNGLVRCLVHDESGLRHA